MLDVYTQIMLYFQNSAFLYPVYLIGNLQYPEKTDNFSNFSAVIHQAYKLIKENHKRSANIYRYHCMLQKK